MASNTSDPAATVAPPAAEPAVPQASALERRFHLSERATDVGTEVRAGLTTFMVMSYIIVVNAVVLTTGTRIAGQDVSFAAIVTSTCLVAGVISLAMGLAVVTSQSGTRDTSSGQEPVVK